MRIVMAAALSLAWAGSAEAQQGLRVADRNCREAGEVARFVFGVYESDGRLPVGVSPAEALGAFAAFGQMIGYVEARIAPQADPYATFGEKVLTHCAANPDAAFGAAVAVSTGG